HYVPDGHGGMRLSSAAFDNSSDGTGMSVTLGGEAEEAGITPERALARHPGFGLASFHAGACRQHRQSIERNPTSEDPHHALVNGDKPKAVRRALSKVASMLIAPTSAIG
ncbi:MAG TPA: hypothetical protein VMS76_07400, partial [Planctomycetota bacterium]|nr:hypothetical protein [Planctomycetota bacterium]